MDADFADLFEVRGLKRQRRGERLPAERGSDSLVMRYRGLDRQDRAMRIACSPAPSAVSPSGLELDLVLEPHAATSYLVTCTCQSGEATQEMLPFPEARREVLAGLRGTGHCTIETSNIRFNEWLARSVADLRLMRTRTGYGIYPYAGVPWYSTPFGRDGIITALETLWMDPDMSRGVLHFLAATQATVLDHSADAQPGKILHECRRGEMAALGEVPFGRYYGSVDATPLFVVLAGAYYQRTGDLELAATLWPHVEAALEWIDTHGDPDGDGFVEYQRTTPHGLVHQGWKDSQDAVFHADGTPAESPIALCEVQGYVFAARQAAARLAVALGQPDRARRLAEQARDLQRRFEETFWCEEIGTYALALDGAKQPCRVRTSNPGHCLFSGISSSARARRIRDGLLSEAFFTGWGIRTVARGEALYNPMSYHNGSVWPHDNALVAAGFARYGGRRSVFRVLGGLFDAAAALDLFRLPELYCGFERRPGEGPTRYPVACAPQAWAAASPMLLLQACLGLSVSGTEHRILFERPLLPETLERVWIRHLPVGQDTVDLVLGRNVHDVAVHVERRTGPVEVLVIK